MLKQYVLKQYKLFHYTVKISGSSIYRFSHVLRAIFRRSLFLCKNVTKSSSTENKVERGRAKLYWAKNAVFNVKTYPAWIRKLGADIHHNCIAVKLISP